MLNRFHFLLLFTLSIGLGSCTPKFLLTNPGLSYHPSTKIYFPANIFGVGSSLELSYSHLLDTISEPSLYAQKDSTTETYRLLVLPSFSPWRVIRLFRLNDEVYLV